MSALILVVPKSQCAMSHGLTQLIRDYRYDAVKMKRNNPLRYVRPTMVQGAEIFFKRFYFHTQLVDCD